MKNKSFIGFWLVLSLSLVFFLLVAPFASPSKNLYLKPKGLKTEGSVFFNFIPLQKTVRVGESFLVEVEVNGQEELIGADLFLRYNPQTLALLKITPGDFFSSPVELSKKIDHREGKIFYAIGSFSTAKGEGKILVLEFKAEKPGESFLNLQPESSIVGFKQEKLSFLLPEEGRYFVFK